MKEFDYGESLNFYLNRIFIFLDSRHFGETHMNKESSRSHTIFQFNIESRSVKFFIKFFFFVAKF